MVADLGHRSASGAMSDFEEYLARRLRRAIWLIDDCPRCGPCFILDDGNPAEACRCWLCGMDVEAEGPAKPIELTGITGR